MEPADTTTLLLVRHGHVPGIEPARYRGRTEIELTERGILEARNTAQWISKKWRPTIVYTSPLKRCVDTAKIIARQCDVNAQVLPHLNDLDYGEWRWKTHDEAAAEWPMIYRCWEMTPHLVRFPNGESLQDLLTRAADAVRVARERHPRQTIVMVSHDSVNRALLMHILDQPLSAYWNIAQAPCAINEISLTADSAVAMSINQTAHLDATNHA